MAPYRCYDDVRRLILEIVALRRTHARVEEWRCIADTAKDKGDFRAPFGALHQLRLILRSERERRGEI